MWEIAPAGHGPRSKMARSAVPGGLFGHRDRLFCEENTRMFPGDAKAAIDSLIPLIDGSRAAKNEGPRRMWRGLSCLRVASRRVSAFGHGFCRCLALGRHPVHENLVFLKLGRDIAAQIDGATAEPENRGKAKSGNGGGQNDPIDGDRAGLIGEEILENHDWFPVLKAHARLRAHWSEKMVPLWKHLDHPGAISGPAQAAAAKTGATGNQARRCGTAASWAAWAPPSVGIHHRGAELRDEPVVRCHSGGAV